jgi:hypothetical protein
MTHYSVTPIAPNVEEYACEHCAFRTISPREMTLHLEYVHKIKAEPEAEPVAKPKRKAKVSDEL